MPTAIEPEVDADATVTKEPESRVSTLNPMAQKLSAWSQEWHEENDEPKSQPLSDDDKASAPGSPDPKATAKDTKEIVATKEAPKEDPIPDSIKSQKAKDDFKLIRGERDEFKTKATTFETELTKLRGEVETLRKRNGDASSEQLKAITTERDNLVKKLETIDLANSDRFTGYFKTETEKYIGTAKSVAGEHGDALAKLMTQPRSEKRSTAIREILEQMDSLDADVVRGALTNIERLKYEREDALSKGEENYKKLKEVEGQERQKADAQAKANREALAERLVERAREFSGFQKKDGDTEHNSKVESREQFVRSFIRGELSDDIMAFTPILAGEALHLREVEIPALKGHIAKLEAQVASYVSANPKAGGGDHRAGEPKRKGFIQAFIDSNPQ